MTWVLVLRFHYTMSYKLFIVGFAKPSFALIQRYTTFKNPHLQLVNCGFKLLKALTKRKTLVIQSLLMLTIYCHVPIVIVGHPFTLKDTVSSQKLESTIDRNDIHYHEDFLVSTDKFTYYSTHQLNINKAKESTLRAAGIFKDRELLLIEKHRNEYGGFVDKEELYSIPTFSKERASFLCHFITTKKTLDQSNLDLTDGNHSIITRHTSALEQQAGFRNGNFQGDAWQHYFRYKYQLHQRMGWGITLEKDAGEPLYRHDNVFSFKKAQSGFDYQSAHFFYKSPHSFVREIYLGDYSLSIGQGLHFWNGFGFGKLADAVEVKKSKPALSPYRSANEWNFLRGGALKLGKPNVHVIAFVSTKKRDANIDKNGISTSLPTTGLHRTVRERANKGAIKEKLWGVRLNYQKTRFQCGINHSHTSYTHTLKKAETLYNTFAFDGNSLQLTSMDLRWVGSRIEYFGEHSIATRKKHAHLNGLDFYVSDALKLNLTHRYYSQGFFAPYANAFGDASKNQNETGIYSGLRLDISPKWSISTYYDLYKFPWTSYRSIAPVSGKQYALRLSYQPNDNIALYCLFKKTHEKRNLSSRITGLKSGIPTAHSQARFHIAYSINDVISLKNRIELVSWKTDQLSEHSVLLYQDIRFKHWKHFPCTLTLRLAFAEVDSYDSRIYTYENDVLYTFNFTSFNEDAIRYYVLVNYKLTSRLSLWFRFSRTSLANNQATFGQGDYFINSSQRSVFRFQAMYQF